MWHHHHSRFENVLRDYICRMPSKDSGKSYAWMLRSIVELLGLSSSEYYLVVDILKGYPAPWPSGISDFYDPSVPPEKLDSAIRDIKKRSFKSIHRFVSENLFLEPLTRALCTEEISEYFFQSVFDMIVRFGERAIDFFDTCFLELNETGKNVILGIISKIGGKKAVSFLEKYFDDCMALNRGETLSACEELACRFCLDRIRPKINKHQIDIDDSYMLISLLTGERTPEIQKMLKAYYQREQENTRVLNSFHSGDIIDTFKPYMDIELKCRHCGDINTYRTKRVIVDKTGDNYVAREIECINCGERPEFDITPFGNRRISMEMMRMTFVNSPEDIQKAREI
ncbi:MAG: hypothetical protein ACKVE4_00365 [Dissulfuribacterales bacterium]